MNVVVVHRGARDAYQAARALQDAGMLDTLVTDLYWGADARWASALQKILPARIIDSLLKRYAPGLRSSKVTSVYGNGVLSHLMEKLPVPFDWKRRATRRTDDALGRRAGAIARRNGAALLSYSYYADAAFARQLPGIPKLLFQLHPHPASVRSILETELHAHPECSESLLREWELSLPQQDFDRLCGEALKAEHCFCASSFTRKTLIENGVAEQSVHVIPYGVDLKRFTPDGAARSESKPLRLLFVGTINQRKGIKYLLEALRLLNTRQLEVQICGRVVDSLSLFKPFAGRVTITPSVSHAELVESYRRADLFVLPSVAEGFGQVLLESLSCGLPILSTTRTAAPDLIEEGRQGFVVNPADPAALAERIDWALSNRSRMASMRAEARTRAEHFTWKRFRRDLAQAVSASLGSPSPVAVQSVSTKEPAHV